MKIFFYEIFNLKEIITMKIKIKLNLKKNILIIQFY